jgi:DNA polymerase-1
MAATVGIPLKEAEKFLADMKERFTIAERWAAHQVENIRTAGYVEDIIGRRMYFMGGRPDDFTTEARNYPVQAGAASSMKMASLNNWYETLFDMNQQVYRYDARQVLQIHDEVVLEVREDQAEEVAHQLTEHMAKVGAELCPDVPIVADVAIEKRWQK